MTTTPDRTCGNCGKEKCKATDFEMSLTGLIPCDLKDWTPIPAPDEPAIDAHGGGGQGEDILREAAQCLDDCLIRIYPEEFEKKHHEEARKRWGKYKGTISRIATIALKLRKMAESPTAQDVKYLQVLPLTPIPESTTYTASNFVPPAAQDIMAVLEDDGLVAIAAAGCPTVILFKERMDAILHYRAAVLERIKQQTERKGKHE